MLICIRRIPHVEKFTVELVVCIRPDTSQTILRTDRGTRTVRNDDFSLLLGAGERHY